MHTSNPDLPVSPRPVSDVVSKSYQLLAATVAFTGVTAWPGMGLPFAYEHPFILMLLSFGALFAVIITGAKDQPIALPLVFVFTGLMG